MVPMKRNYKRQHVIVKGFQARFVIVQLLWVTGALVVFAAALLGPLVYTLLTAGPTVATAVADQFLLLHTTLWPVLAALLAMLAAVFIYMSHRVAGPLYRFRLAYKDLGEGRLDTVVKTRPTDYLKEEEDALNAMIGALRDRVRDGQRATDALEQVITERRADPRPPTVADLDALQARVRDVKAALSRFNTGTGSQGFSLIELIIIVAVILVLGGLASAGYFKALDAARVARATGDIHAIELEATTHSVRQGCLPASLADLGRAGMTDPWGRPYVYGVIGKPAGPAAPTGCNACLSGSCVASGAVRIDGASKPLNVDFDVYSLGKDGLTQPLVTALASLDDVLRASNGGFVGLARTY